MKKKPGCLIIFTVFLTASPALAAGPMQFASDTLAFYLLLNITIVSMLIFVLMIFAELYRDRRRRKDASREFVDRRRPEMRSNGLPPSGRQMAPAVVRVERERRLK